MILNHVRSWFEHAWRSTRSAALQIALPETCAGCGTTGNWFCLACEAQLVREPPAGCLRCGRKGSRRPQCPRCAPLFPSNLRQLRAGFSYQGAMRRAVQRFKYNGEYQRGYDLGERLSFFVPSILPVQCFDLVIPVPLHPGRYRSRGFNQSGILAE
jgi:predicted amidophosphoribosyltransferase